MLTRVIMSEMQLGIRYMRITEQLAEAVSPFLPLVSFSQLKINQEGCLYNTTSSLMVLLWVSFVLFCFTEFLQHVGPH